MKEITLNSSSKNYPVDKVCYEIQDDSYIQIFFKEKEKFTSFEHLLQLYADSAKHGTAERRLFTAKFSQEDLTIIFKKDLKQALEILVSCEIIDNRTKELINEEFREFKHDKGQKPISNPSASHGGKWKNFSRLLKSADSSEKANLISSAPSQKISSQDRTH